MGDYLQNGRFLTKWEICDFSSHQGIVSCKYFDLHIFYFARTKFSILFLTTLPFKIQFLPPFFTSGVIGSKNAEPSLEKGYWIMLCL